MVLLSRCKPSKLTRILQWSANSCSDPIGQQKRQRLRVPKCGRSLLAGKFRVWQERRYLRFCLQPFSPESRVLFHGFGFHREERLAWHSVAPITGYGCNSSAFIRFLFIYLLLVLEIVYLLIWSWYNCIRKFRRLLALRR